METAIAVTGNYIVLGVTMLGVFGVVAVAVAIGAAKRHKG